MANRAIPKEQTIKFMLGQAGEVTCALVEPYDGQYKVNPNKFCDYVSFQINMSLF